MELDPELVAGIAVAALALALVALRQVAALVRRVQRLEGDKRALEASLSLVARERAAPAGTITPGTPGLGELDAPAPEVAGPIAADARIDAPVGPATEPRGVEAALGLTWATRVGGTLLLAGLVFFFKHAVDRGWLTPWARVAVGVGVGAFCLAAAALMRRTASRGWVHMVAGVGLAVLLASAWASWGLYGLLAPSVAFAVLAALVVLGGALAVAWSGEALLVTAALAGLSIPGALGSEVGGPALRVVYPLVVAAAALVVAVPRRWIYAAGSVVVGVCVMGFVWGWIAWPGALAVALAVAAAAWRWPDGQDRDLLAAGVALILGLLLPRLAALPLGPLVVAVHAALALALLTLGRFRVRAPWLGVVVIAVAAASLAERAVVSGLAGAPPLPILAMGGLWAALVVFDAARLGEREPSAAAAVQVGLVGVAWGGLAVAALGVDAGGALAAVAALVAALDVATAALWWRAGRRELAGVALVLGLAALAIAAQAAADGVVVTVAWALLAVVAAHVGRAGGQPVVVLAGLATLAGAVAHGFFGEWSAVADARGLYLDTGGAQGALLPPLLVGARGVALLVTGAAALAAAPPTLAALARERRAFGVATRFAGLALLALWVATEIALAVDHAALDGLSGVASQEAARAAAASTRGLLTTLGLGLFAGGALAWGFLREEVHYRWFSLGLLALTVLKLVALDLWELDQIAQTVVLVALGALLLASGFLYARFGGRLRGLFVPHEAGSPGSAPEAAGEPGKEG